MTANTRSHPLGKSAIHPNTQKIQNKILLGLSKQELSKLSTKLEFVSLPVRTVLNEAGEAIKFAYFVNSGLASVLSILSDGKSVEVGLAGSEGFVGLPLVVGLRTSHTRIIMQVAGSAFKIKSTDLVTAVHSYPKLSASLNRYTQQMTLQASQVAACNRAHGVDERLARWLLMSQDRLGGDIVSLTQEFLAHMLGTRRASVTVAAGMLQRAGLISYRRGALKIENRSLLERATCDCYRSITEQTRKWRIESE
jgi:CRP-like cAMP-binding protein